jgi:hypothetical protein
VISKRKVGFSTSHKRNGLPLRSLLEIAYVQHGRMIIVPNPAIMKRPAEFFWWRPSAEGVNVARVIVELCGSGVHVGRVNHIARYLVAGYYFFSAPCEKFIESRLLHLKLSEKNGNLGCNLLVGVPCAFLED